MRAKPPGGLARLNSCSATEASYACDDGTRLTAAFSPPGESLGGVVLKIAGSPNKIVLPQTPSADGCQYADANMEFWIKGNDATFTHAGGRETCDTVR